MYLVVFIHIVCIYCLSIFCLSMLVLLCIYLFIYLCIYSSLSPSDCSGMYNSTFNCSISTSSQTSILLLFSCTDIFNCNWKVIIFIQSLQNVMLCMLWLQLAQISCMICSIFQIHLICDIVHCMPSKRETSIFQYKFWTAKIQNWCAFIE